MLAADRKRHWERLGFAGTVSALPLATTHDATDTIRVHLRIPAGNAFEA